MEREKFRFLCPVCGNDKEEHWFETENKLLGGLRSLPPPPYSSPDQEEMVMIEAKSEAPQRYIACYTLICEKCGFVKLNSGAKI